MDRSSVTRLSFQNKCNESGFAATESLVAIGIIGIIVAAAGLQVQNATTAMQQMQRNQAIDALEINLFSLLSNQEIVQHSIAASSHQDLKSCLAGQSRCDKNKAYDIPMILPGQTTPFTGQTAYYDMTASPCNKASCQALRIITTVQAVCYSESLCGPPQSIAVTYRISDKSKELARGRVEVLPSAKNLGSALTQGCPDGHILRGVGLQGSALCTAFSDITYADTTFNHEIAVTPQDCRKDGKGFVRGIQADGHLICSYE